jgi:hypothetical protein
MKRDIIPQLIAISAAGTIISYIYYNIDTIREQQRIATEQAMLQQSETIRDAQEKQAKAILKARQQQEEARLRAEKLAEDMKQR